MERFVCYLFLVYMALLLQVQGFQPHSLLHIRTRPNRSSLGSLMSNVEKIFENPPDLEKTRLRLVLSGDSVCSALFRSGKEVFEFQFLIKSCYQHLSQSLYY